MSNFLKRMKEGKPTESEICINCEPPLGRHEKPRTAKEKGHRNEFRKPFSVVSQL